ncbi:MAG: hypothetical protein KDJ90_00710, partial [Nitratireductor sp.]|nr:hypothetical protein [Nitratireductor sp.]
LGVLFHRRIVAGAEGSLQTKNPDCFAVRAKCCPPGTVKTWHSMRMATPGKLGSGGLCRSSIKTILFRGR